MNLRDIEKRAQEDELPLIDEANNLVFGRGSEDADVFIVGEAPGEDEDREGEPFVGRSGQVLSTVLAQAGLEEGEDTYIANVVKYRPPNNRDPRVDEIQAHAPYLLRQIHAVHPEIIVSLGNTASEFFKSDDEVFSGITQERGKTFTVDVEGDVYTVFPTYHPAATLYDSSLKDDFVKDFERVATRRQ
jgi:DNA polymerase